MLHQESRFSPTYLIFDSSFLADLKDHEFSRDFLRKFCPSPRKFALVIASDRIPDHNCDPSTPNGFTRNAIRGFAMSRLMKI